MSKKIQLTKDQFTIVDDEDYEHLIQWKWHSSSNSNGRFYAVRTGKMKEARKQFRIHRVITDCPEGLVVDHINHDTLDNRKINLRICTQQQNTYNNANVRKKMYSRHKGVSFNKSANKYTAQIRVQKRLIHLGCFADEGSAGMAYQLAAKEYYGEFAYSGE